MLACTLRKTQSRKSDACCTLWGMIGTRTKATTTLFGRRLRDARLAAGMTQAQLGGLLGMDDQNTAAPRVSRYETGKYEPSLETMAQIADALGLPVAYFHATSDPLAQIILAVSKLDPKRQEEASAHLKTWLGE